VYPIRFAAGGNREPEAKVVIQLRGLLRSPSKVERWVLLARATGFDVKKLAFKCSVSVRQLENHLQHDLARSPKNWLNEQRIIAATYLLRESHCVKTVALELHFKQSSHFCREFKNCIGLSPREFLLIHDRGLEFRV
jgi:AraC-like DNA-binding protein